LVADGAGVLAGADSLFSEFAISPTFATVATVERASTVVSGVSAQLAATRLIEEINSTILRIN
jgi:hypothetical protein